MTRKRIAVLTSGGDCAGLNAAVRAVTLRARSYGWDVIGIRQGTNGVWARPLDVQDMNALTSLDDLLRRGGTILGTTNKGNPFEGARTDADIANLPNVQRILEGIRMLNIEALIGVGGDGSMAILKKLAALGGFPMVAIPKTIDNDLGCTEASLGFRTAVDLATEALDRLQPTAASHDRVMILEVMGRDAGHIAIEAGIAGGADIILIPEIPYSMDAIVTKIMNLKADQRNYALVIVAEAVKGGRSTTTHRGGIGDYLAHHISERTGAESRVTVLGHVLRGAPPNAQDRLMANAFGVRAVDLIAAGRFDRMVTWQNRSVVDVAIDEAIRQYHSVDVDGIMVKTARALGICMGDQP